MLLSLVIPVYKNEENLPDLLRALADLSGVLPGALEVVFVVDGSPDGSLDFLRRTLPAFSVPTRLVELSRNFGSFSAITAGLECGQGDFFAVVAADLQEPPELVATFYRMMADGQADVVVGHRRRRDDPLVSRLLAQTFWSLYRRLVVPDMPSGGVDVFGCTRQVRDRLIALKEANSSLVALVLWVGFKRAYVPYDRQKRQLGRSAWTFGRKFRYAMDSIFSFTDLPIKLLLWVGALGMAAAVLAGVTVVAAWALGFVPVLGYAPLMVAICGVAGLTAFGLGVVGQYLWLSLQNTRDRPTFIVRTVERFGSNN